MTIAQDTYLTTKQAAEALNVSCSLLEKLRVSGDGPPYYKIGPRRVLYARKDLDDWISARRRQSTSESGDPSPRPDTAKGGQVQ